MNDRQLDALELSARVAVAAACLERVYDWYRYGSFLFRVRHAPAGVDREPEADLVRRALDLAWSFVETGTADAALLEALIAGLSKVPPDVDGEDLSQATSIYVDGIVLLLRAIKDPTPASASGAIERSRYALMSGLEEIIEDQDEVDRFAELEMQWQENVLARVQALPPLFPRQRLDDLIAAAAPWRPHVIEYRRYNGR